MVGRSASQSARIGHRWRQSDSQSSEAPSVYGRPHAQAMYEAEIRRGSSAASPTDQPPSSLVFSSWCKLDVSGTFDDPFGAVYEPIGSDAENGHEAKLVVPSRVAEKMFSQGGPFMECEYGVFPDAAGEMVVTLKGGRRAVEYCRAEMRDMAVAVGVKRVKMMPWWVGVFVVAVVVVVLKSNIVDPEPCARLT